MLVAQLIAEKITSFFLKKRRAIRKISRLGRVSNFFLLNRTGHGFLKSL